MRYLLVCASFMVLAVAQVPAWAEAPVCADGMQGVEFYRDDLATLKKQLEVVIAAVGEPAAPYGRGKENWSFPAGTCKSAKGYVPIELDYDTSFSTEGQEKKLENEYRKKMMAAQAAGNMQAMAQIAQEMQQKAVGNAMANENKQPVDMSLDVNVGDSMTIDPDSVLRDGTGFIALKTNEDPNAGSETVTMYFDKIALKDARRIASFNLYRDLRMNDKLGLASIRIRLSGPKATVEKMVKDTDAEKVLGALESGYTERQH